MSEKQKDLSKFFIFFMKNDQGEEGIVTLVDTKTNIPTPGIAGNIKRVFSLYPVIKKMAQIKNKPFRIALYEYKEDVKIEELLLASSPKHPNPEDEN